MNTGAKFGWRGIGALAKKWKKTVCQSVGQFVACRMAYERRPGGFNNMWVTCERAKVLIKYIYIYIYTNNSIIIIGGVVS